MEDNYKEIIDKYLKDLNTEELVKHIFLLKPSLKIPSKKVHDIFDKISKEYNIPFKDFKIIGSTHTGFSFIKPKKSKEIKFFSDDSDLDIAIINKEFFYFLYKNTLRTTKYFKDNTSFFKPEYEQLFKENYLKGYIRPDTIGDVKFRNNWINFFYELSKEYNLKKISAAIYLDEETFNNKINESLNIYKRKLEGQNGK